MDVVSDHEKDDKGKAGEKGGKGGNLRAKTEKKGKKDKKKGNDGEMEGRARPKRRVIPANVDIGRFRDVEGHITSSDDGEIAYSKVFGTAASNNNDKSVKSIGQKARGVGRGRSRQASRNRKAVLNSAPAYVCFESSTDVIEELIRFTQNPRMRSLDHFDLEQSGLRNAFLEFLSKSSLAQQLLTVMQCDHTGEMLSDRIVETLPLSLYLAGISGASELVHKRLIECVSFELFLEALECSMDTLSLQSRVFILGQAEELGDVIPLVSNITREECSNIILFSKMPVKLTCDLGKLVHGIWRVEHLVMKSASAGYIVFVVSKTLVYEYCVGRTVSTPGKPPREAFDEIVAINWVVNHNNVEALQPANVTLADENARMRAELLAATSKLENFEKFESKYNGMAEELKKLKLDAAKKK